MRTPLLTLAALLVLAAPADATTAVVDKYSDAISIYADDGNANNNISVITKDGALFITDSAGGVYDTNNQLGGCQPQNGGLLCPTGSGEEIRIYPKDGSNTVTVSSKGIGKSIIVEAGSDKDVVDASGSTIPAIIKLGNGSGQVATGGSGDDALGGGTGSETLNGGGGVDSITYGGRDKVISVTQDGVANDGAAGEGDNVGGDIERITLGNKDDIAVGGAADNGIAGGPGNDTIDGGPGKDELNGEADADVLHGGEGFDKLIGAGGLDTLFGDAGDDTLTGGADVDKLSGGVGDDLLAGEAGNDQLRGEAGDDSLSTDDGADLVDGGEGTLDSVSYAGHKEGVVLSLDGLANDGRPSEGDNLVDVESLGGSPFADVITGDAGTDYLYGYEGDDRLDGGAGLDVVRGGLGAADIVTGRDDALERDDLGCNDGPADHAVADANDIVASDCETVDRAPLPPNVKPGAEIPVGGIKDVGANGTGSGNTNGSGTGGNGDAPPAAVKLSVTGVPSKLTLKKLRKGFTIKVAANRPTTARIELRIPASAAAKKLPGTLVLAAKTIQAGPVAKPVTFKLASSTKLRGTPKLTLAASGTDASGSWSRSVKIARR